VLIAGFLNHQQHDNVSYSSIQSTRQAVNHPKPSRNRRSKVIVNGSFNVTFLGPPLFRDDAAEVQSGRKKAKTKKGFPCPKNRETSYMETPDPPNDTLGPQNRWF